jgi:uncharacterized protein (TIGR00266 family)
MQFDIAYRPAHTLAFARLNPGESVTAESGAMVAMSTNIQMQTGGGAPAGGGLMGGLMKGLKRMLAGESFFRNTFTAAGGPGEVLLAHSLLGDMRVLDMNPTGYIIASSAFIASTPVVQIDTKSQGFKGFFSGGGMFMMQATGGPGQVLVGGFGGISELICDGSLVIDTGHLVAFDASLTFSVGKSGGGWIASMLSGEGLVCNFQGQGRIWIQSRNPQEYGQAVGSLLPAKEG